MKGESPMYRRLAMAGVAVGALIAAGALLASVGPSPTASLATGSSNSNMAAHLLANGAGTTTPGASGRFGSRPGPSGRFGWGFGGRRGHAGYGRVLTVTGVSGNT